MIPTKFSKTFLAMCGWSALWVGVRLGVGGEADFKGLSAEAVSPDATCGWCESNSKEVTEHPAKPSYQSLSVSTNIFL